MNHEHVGNESRRLLNVAEMAEYIRSTPGSIYNRVACRRIPPECVVRIGRAVRFDRREVDRWIEASKPHWEPPRLDVD